MATWSFEAIGAVEGIFGRFPSVDPVAVRARVPYLGKIYIEKKALEPKLHYTALNQLKNHTAHKESGTGIQVSGFYCNSTVIFRFFRVYFFPHIYKSL